MFQVEDYVIALSSILAIDTARQRQTWLYIVRTPSQVIMAPRTTLRLVRECQLLMRPVPGMYRSSLCTPCFLMVPGRGGMREHEIADKLASKG